MESIFTCFFILTFSNGLLIHIPFVKTFKLYVIQDLAVLYLYLDNTLKQTCTKPNTGTHIHHNIIMNAIEKHMSDGISF